MGGERLEQAELLADGIRGDRLVQVVSSGRIVTARIRPRLLGLHARLGEDGVPLVDGRRWDDPAVLAAGREATKLPEAELQADDFGIALDCSVVRGGTIRVGDPVELIPAR